MKSLFEAFKTSTKKQWLAKVEKDLRGKSLESLDWIIHENLTVTPFAHRDDFKKQPTPIFDKRKSNSWEKGAWIFVKNIKTARREALALLDSGAEAICFEFENDPNKDDMDLLLKGIHLEWISTHFILPYFSWKRIIQSFMTIAREQKNDLSKVRFSFQFRNPLLVDAKGHKIFNKTTERLDEYPLFCINGKPYYDGDNNASTELANTLRYANQQLLEWTKNDLPPDKLVHQIQFSLQLGDSYYLNIAKIRALKLLWQLLLKGWKIKKQIPCQIAAHLTDTTHTKDLNYNQIKATAQAMAAVIGGANRIFIYPSDTYKNKKGTQNRQRLALNIQHLMQLESYMDRVIDPAAGSYFLENLTDKIAAAAWEEFSKELADKPIN
ncbi:MAG: methylmalonyl-CoA mutase family protein [Bacteroidota bacterium]